jgi:hypothetical protein
MRTKIEARRQSNAVRAMKLLLVIVGSLQLIGLAQLWTIDPASPPVRGGETVLALAAAATCAAGLYATHKRDPRIRKLLRVLAGISAASFALAILFGGAGFGLAGVGLAVALAIIVTKPPLSIYFERRPVAEAE